MDDAPKRYEMQTGNPCALALKYTLLTYAISWMLWCLAGILIHRASASPLLTLAGALEVLGTLAPLFSTYFLFGSVKACGLAPCAHAGCDGGDPQNGFWRFAFGGTSSKRGWMLFSLLCVWRWVMFRLAFGFPATPVDALANFALSLPMLLLGGGFEEVGWRGCLQPALATALARKARRKGAAALASAASAIITGVIWGAWHLPLFFIPGTFQSTIPFGAVLVAGIALSCSFGAMYGVTHSLLYPIASHAWYNAMLVATPAFGPVALVLFAIEFASLFPVLRRMEVRDGNI